MENNQNDEPRVAEEQGMIHSGQVQTESDNQPQTIVQPTEDSHNDNLWASEEKSTVQSNQVHTASDHKPQKDILPIVSGMIIVSLMIQTVILMFTKGFLADLEIDHNLSIVIFPIICAVLTLILYYKNKLNKLGIVILVSWIVYVVSLMIIWVEMLTIGVFMNLGENNMMFFLLVAIFPAIGLVIFNVIPYYLTILIGYIMLSVFKKIAKGLRER